MKLEELQSGQQFGPYRIDLARSETQAYIAATGDSQNPHTFPGNFHPLHIDAFVLSKLIAELGIVQDRIETIHAGQQMTVYKIINSETAITATARLKSVSNRRGSIWAIFETDFSDAHSDLVAQSSSTIILMP